MNSAVRAAIACLVISFAFHSTWAVHPARAQNTATTAGAEKKIQAGEKLYASSCVFCHGVDGNGSVAAPSLRNLDLSAGQIAGVISDGKAGTAMPAFKDTYSPAQIGDLAEYLLSLAKKGAKTRAADGLRIRPRQKAPQSTPTSALRATKWERRRSSITTSSRACRRTISFTFSSRGRCGRLPPTYLLASAWRLRNI